MCQAAQKLGGVYLLFSPHRHNTQHSHYTAQSQHTQHTQVTQHKQHTTYTTCKNTGLPPNVWEMEDMSENMPTITLTVGLCTTQNIKHPFFPKINYGSFECDVIYSMLCSMCVRISRFSNCVDCLLQMFFEVYNELFFTSPVWQHFVHCARLTGVLVLSWWVESTFTKLYLHTIPVVI